MMTLEHDRFPFDNPQSIFLQTVTLKALKLHLVFLVSAVISPIFLCFLWSMPSCDGFSFSTSTHWEMGSTNPNTCEVISSPDIDFITSDNSWVSSGCLSDSELEEGDGSREGFSEEKLPEIGEGLRRWSHPFLHPLVHITNFYWPSFSTKKYSRSWE